MNARINKAEQLVNDLKIDACNGAATWLQVHRAEEALDDVYFEEIERMWLKDGLTLAQIAAEIGSTESSVYDYVEAICEVKHIDRRCIK